MVEKVVAKRQRAPLFTPSSLDDVHVVAVRPVNRPVEEGRERIVRMKNVAVSQGPKAFTVRPARLKSGN